MTTPSIEALYAKFGPIIYARSKRMLKDAAAAEDATQDIFLKVMRNMDVMPAGESVMPWILRITSNHCLNVIRDGKRHAQPVEHVPEVADDEFEADVVTRNFAQRVIDTTPEKLMAPAMLYHGKGIEQARVAEALGVSRRTVLYRLAAFARHAVRMQELAEQM